MTQEQEKRIKAQMEYAGGEDVTVEKIISTMYVFGSELACLRIFAKYNSNGRIHNPKIRKGYSEPRETHFISLETELSQEEVEVNRPETIGEFLKKQIDQPAQVMEEEKNIYEIYTKKPETGETGWDIFWVRSHRDNIKSFPHFDCIISRGDLPNNMAMVVNWDGKRIS
jgi:hypothetical protein